MNEPPGQHMLHLRVYDSQGRHVGFNTNSNLTETQIPGSFYEQIGQRTTFFLPTNISSFKLVIDATYAEQQSESFTITLRSLQENNTSSEIVFSSVIQKGVSSEFDVQEPSSSAIQVTAVSPATMSILSSKPPSLGYEPLLLVIPIVIIFAVLLAIALVYQKKRARA